MNVPGRWLDRLTTWRKLALNTWGVPNNATIYGTLEVDVGPLQAYLKEQSERHGVKCTLTHAVTRGLAVLLRRYPDCNVLVRGHRIWLRDQIDIFHQVAMPIDEGSGHADLSGAVVRRADEKPIHEIARDLGHQALAVREQRDGQMAKTRNLLFGLPGPVMRLTLKTIGWLSYRLNLAVPGSPRDSFGGAMVTAVGMLGIKLAYVPLVTFSHCPIIILVGQVEDRAVVRDGQIVARPMCTLTATLDHRVIDGFMAGLLARDMKRLLEEPALLDAAAAPPVSASGAT
jgi:pyruvate/2-oxoglutarate dehydrogenase complex dihydrolipoamide acyltransferase (E2) component